MRPFSIFSATSLKRAIAELALIVAGVTIALWADAWVQKRSELATESLRVSALHQNALETLAIIRTASEEAADASRALREILALQDAPQDIEQASELLRHGLLFGPGFFPEMSVYDDLKNSGELSLLTNAELRSALSRMDSGLEQLRLTQDDLMVVQQLNIDSYMVERLDLRWLFGHIAGIDHADGPVERDLQFLVDAQFQNRVMLKLDLVTQFELVLDNVEARLLAVLQAIESQLGEPAS